MIKLLRRRFIIAAMAAITALLLLIAGIINVVSAGFVNNRIEQIMSHLTDGQGRYSPPIVRRKGEDFDPAAFNRRPTPDDLMGARFFLAKTDAQGNLLDTDLMHILAVTPEEAAEMVDAVLKKGSRSGHIQQFYYRLTPLTDHGEGSFLIFLDVTAQNHFTTTVRLVSIAAVLIGWLLMLPLVILLSHKAIVPIARNMEKQKQFVTNAGHEIKTPLAIIMANTDALELHQGESKWSNNIRTQAVRLNGLMQNLLVLAKMDETGTSLPFSDFSLDTLIEDLIQPYLATAEDKAVAFDKCIQRDVSVHGHRESLAQLVSILLDNSVKYTPVGGRINISLQCQGEKKILQVANTVDRFPDTDPEKFFDRFYRGDAARTQKTGGYGIGLSAAKTIVDAHGGTIQAKYQEDTIAFTVVL